MTETVISAEGHFETLREGVWRRFAARHRGYDRDAFDDLYNEWWARESARAADGRPSRAAAPAAYIAEAVHRVLIDDTRARARGIGRDEKGTLEVLDLDNQVAAAADDDTAASAAYEALVHRILTLVHGRLTSRETRVFVFGFLYMRTSEETAQALGLTVPRVKKDRRKIAAKIGSEVWRVLEGELDLCAIYDEKSLPAIFELLSVHVEDCDVCARSLGGVRTGALAIIGPELLLAEASTQGAAHLLDSLTSRVYGLLHRGGEVLTAMPPQGRFAAAAAVAATAVAGGAATVVPSGAQRHRQPRTPVAARAAGEPQPTITTVATPAARPVTTPRPAARRSRRRRAAVATPAPARTAVATSAPTQAPAEPASFEQQAPVAATAAPAPSTPTTDTGKEFGFEHP